MCFLDGFWYFKTRPSAGRRQKLWDAPRARGAYLVRRGHLCRVHAPAIVAFAADKRITRATDLQGIQDSVDKSKRADIDLLREVLEEPLVVQYLNQNLGTLHFIHIDFRDYFALIYTLYKNNNQSTANRISTDADVLIMN